MLKKKNYRSECVYICSNTYFWCRCVNVTMGNFALHFALVLEISVLWPWQKDWEGLWESLVFVFLYLQLFIWNFQFNIIGKPFFSVFFFNDYFSYFTVTKFSSIIFWIAWLGSQRVLRFCLLAAVKCNHYGIIFFPFKSFHVTSIFQMFFPSGICLSLKIAKFQNNSFMN